MNGQQFYLPNGKTLFPIIGVRASYDDPLFSDDRMNTTFISSGKISPLNAEAGLCSSDYTYIKNIIDNQFENITVNRSYTSASTLIELITNTYLSEDGTSYEYSQKLRVVVFGNYYTLPGALNQSDALYDKLIELPHNIKPSQKLLGSCTMSWQSEVDDSIPSDISTDTRLVNRYSVYNKNNPNTSMPLICVQFNEAKTAITIGPSAHFNEVYYQTMRSMNLDDLTISYAITDSAIVLNKLANKVDALEEQVASLTGTTLGRYVAR